MSRLWDLVKIGDYIKEGTTEYRIIKKLENRNTGVLLEVKRIRRDGKEFIHVWGFDDHELDLENGITIRADKITDVSHLQRLIDDV